MNRQGYVVHAADGNVMPGVLTCFCTKECPQGLCAGERKPPECVEGGESRWRRRRHDQRVRACAAGRKAPRGLLTQGGCAGHHCPNKAQPILHLDDGVCKCKVA